MPAYEKRKSGWRVRVYYYTADGKRKSISKSGFRAKNDAKAYAETKEAELNREFVAFDPNIAFADYFKEWYETYKVGSILPITLVRYQATEHLLRKYFRDEPLASVTRPQYQKFIRLYGKKHAPSTVREKHALIRRCVESAMYDEVIHKDFTFNITLISNKNKEMQVDYMNITELKQLTNYLLNHLNYHYGSNYLILTAIFTGARLGELLALTWKDINFNFKTVNINKAWNYFEGGKFKTTKNENSKRIIPISDTLVQVLKELKKQKQPKASDQVFLTQFGTVPTSEAVNKTLKSNMKKLGINRKNFHFHSLRHSHVAYLLSLGVDIYAIAKRLGHSDITTTTRTYAYLIDEFKHANDKKITSGLDDLQAKNNEQSKAIEN